MNRTARKSPRIMSGRTTCRELAGGRGVSKEKISRYFKRPTGAFADLNS